MQSIIIGSNQAGQRLDKFLRKCLPEAGSGFLYKMLRKKNITLNGKKAEGKEILSQGDEVKLFFSEETFQKFSKAPAEAASEKEYLLAYQALKGVEILYEDQDILLLNKPAGMLAQKAAPKDLSLNEWLVGYLISHRKGMKEELSTFHPAVCNRLDRNTSGIVLCSASLFGSQTLGRLLKERTLKKYYHTICAGELKEPGFLEGRLIRKENRVVIQNEAGEKNLTGKESLIKTAYRPICAKNGYTLLEVELITGKTHQIRAHLASIGHPVIGDAKYGDLAVNRQLKECFGLQHQLLHAHHVIFPMELSDHMAHLRGRMFTAEPPSYFKEIMKSLGLYGKEG